MSSDGTTEMTWMRHLTCLWILFATHNGCGEFSSDHLVPLSLFDLLLKGARNFDISGRKNNSTLVMFQAAVCSVCRGFGGVQSISYIFKVIPQRLKIRAAHLTICFCFICFTFVL